MNRPCPNRTPACPDTVAFPAPSAFPTPRSGTRRSCGWTAGISSTIPCHGERARRGFCSSASRRAPRNAGRSPRSHDEVPFDGFRPALTRALRVLGLLQPEQAIDDKISAAEREWCFGSMVRCALGLSKANEVIERSGTVVQRLAAMPIESSWITRCSATFLGAVPVSLRVVVLLSNDDKYIEACFAAIRRLRPGTSRINA